MKTTQKKSNATRTPGMDYLAGNGPNPMHADKRGPPGPLEQAFVKGVAEEVAAQDAALATRPEMSAYEAIVAVMRLMEDNRELIGIVKRGACESVSDLATQLGRELSNVSRTLSKMAAYGLVGYEREEGRLKKPVWLLPHSDSENASEWVEAFCVATLLRRGGLDQFNRENIRDMEKAVKDAVDAASSAINRIAKPMVSSSWSKGATA